MAKRKIPVDELAKWAALFEVVAMIERKADAKKINEKHRWKLYKTSHILKYINERSPDIKNELLRDENRADTENPTDFKNILEKTDSE